MKSDFTHENFEDFLKRSADGLRMKAPDKVWQNLSKELNKKRRRFTLGLSAFLLMSSAVGYGIISNVHQPELTTNLPAQTNNESLIDETNSKNNKQTQTSSTSSSTPVISLNKPVVNRSTANENSTPAKVIPLNNTVNLAKENSTTGQTISSSELAAGSTFNPTIVDSPLEFNEEVKDRTTHILPAEKQSVTELPLTIESVVNSYKSKNKKSKFESQLYFTPTVSYRKLSENKSYLRSLQSSLPANYPALNSSVNNNVTHKPDIGFELGYAAKYRLSNKVKIRSGLQFNVNRYDVKAFSSPLSVTTIALNNGNSVQSLNAVSSYSTVQGYKYDWLQNLSFQLSAPIGAEFIIADKEKASFGFGATVQPTYVLGDRAYLITTDYKNYTQVPWLTRHWNVNTAMEAFVNLKSGKTQWQIGPQVRYQLLSSFISKYPVKENLFDFGLKVGVLLNNR